MNKKEIMYRVIKLFCLKKMKSSMSIHKGKSILNITYSYTGDSCVRKQNLENKNYDYDLAVIVPVYNVEEYLDRCIQSITNQKTDFPFQLILINDGSTDLSEKICDKYSNFENVFVIDKKIVVFLQVEI